MMRIEATPEAPGRRGRPPLHESGRKRGAFNTRLSAPIKEALEQAARDEGRSLSEEIEFRLWHSVQDQRALGGPRSAALFRVMGGIAGLESGGKDWAADFEIYNIVVNRWLEVFKDAAPPMPDRVRRQIDRVRANVKQLEGEMDGAKRERRLVAIEYSAKDLRFPPEVRDELRTAVVRAREAAR